MASTAAPKPLLFVETRTAVPGSEPAASTTKRISARKQALARISPPAGSQLSRALLRASAPACAMAKWHARIDQRRALGLDREGRAAPAPLLGHGRHYAGGEHARTSPST